MDADIAILGGGCAGLSLAQRLAHDGCALRVVVLESRADYYNDRTWCFWAPPRHPYANLVARRWSAWRFSTRLQSVVQSGATDLTYQCIPSDAFYRNALSQIEASRTCRMRLECNVHAVTPGPDWVDVETSRGTIRARWVVDTLPARLASVRRASLTQVFLGAEVETEAPVFDPSTVGLMDDMAVDDDGFRFTYVLPFTSRRALIEETRFAAARVEPETLRAGLERALSTRVRSDQVKLVRTEGGAIPMTTRAAAVANSPRIVRAGTGGGAVRASSGYAFARIQRWADSCAQSLAAGLGPVAHPKEPSYRSAIDSLFLRVVNAQPELAPRIFLSMGRELTADTLARFMSDRFGPLDFVSIASALPKGPFLRQLAVTLTERRLA